MTVVCPSELVADDVEAAGPSEGEEGATGDVECSVSFFFHE